MIVLLEWKGKHGLMQLVYFNDYGLELHCQDSPKEEWYVV